MTSLELSSRYAMALFNIGLSANLENQYLDQLNFLAGIFNDPKIKRFFEMPQIVLKKKFIVLEELFGNDLDNTMLSFIKLLIKKKLLSSFSEIKDEFSSLCHEKQGVLSVTIATAIPMDEKTLKILREKLEKIYQKNVVINEKIDPKLLGGARIIAQNKIVDFSLKSRFLKLKNKLLSMKDVS